MEFRRDKPDPRFRRGRSPRRRPARHLEGDLPAVDHDLHRGPDHQQQRQIALNEASWSAVDDEITETTIAELGEPGGVGPGCTGTADPNTLVGGLEPINLASGDVTFSGTARAGVTAVSVTVGALGAKDAVVTPGADPATDPSTWALTVARSELATLPDGNVAVTPTFVTTGGTAEAPTTSSLRGTPRNVLKDTVAPAAPTASPTRATSAAARTRPRRRSRWRAPPVSP